MELIRYEEGKGSTVFLPERTALQTTECYEVITGKFRHVPLKELRSLSPVREYLEEGRIVNVISNIIKKDGGAFHEVISINVQQLGEEDHTIVEIPSTINVHQISAVTRISSKEHGMNIVAGTIMTIFIYLILVL